MGRKFDDPSDDVTGLSTVVRMYVWLLENPRKFDPLMFARESKGGGPTSNEQVEN